MLAGGAARRFGSDKAEALWAGRRLIDHAAAALAPHVETVAICGRIVPDRLSLPDLPAPGLGPLGGLAGALDHAARHGFDAVLSTACDVPDLPDDAVAALLAAGEGAWLAELPVAGLWPALLAAPLLAYLAGDDRSVRGFASGAGVAVIRLGRPIANVNTPEDLAALPTRNVRPE